MSHNDPLLAVFLFDEEEPLEEEEEQKGGTPPRILAKQLHVRQLHRELLKGLPGRAFMDPQRLSDRPM